MREYKVTRNVSELGMMISTTIKSNKTLQGLAHGVNIPPKGLRKVLSKAIKVEDVTTGESIAL